MSNPAATKTRSIRVDASDWRRNRSLAGLLVVVLVLLYLPIVILVAYSFNANRVVTVWTGFSLHWFGVVLSNTDLQRAALNSIVVGLLATLIATAVALAAAIALHQRFSERWKTWALGIINLPLVVPEIVVSVTTLVLFAFLRFDQGLINLVIGHVVFCLPYAFLPIRAALMGLDRRLEEAAFDLYATPFDMFRWVLLPLLMPAIMSGFVLSLVTSLDDFLISMMVGKAGYTTLPVYVYGMMRVGITPEVNAVSTLIILIPVLLFCVLLQFMRLRKSRYGAVLLPNTKVAEL
jgi:spermidine/putrescine transport system permease protein